jgi:cell division protein FtsW
MQQISTKKRTPLLLYDKYFLFSVVALIAIGLLMVTSASVAISERQFHQPFHYLFNQGIHLVLGILVVLIVVRISMKFWCKISVFLLLFGMLLLVLVLVPGIGRQVNGSMRWIGFGPIGVQVSEFMKLAVVIYLAGYLVRRNVEVRTKVSGFVKPMVMLGIIAILLLMEPDFGATVVIVTTAMVMMYLAGVRFWQFAILLLVVLVAMSVLAISSPYRMVRLTTFLNPWANQFDSGYQLTQSLIAFGRGGVFGVGLGGSIQKLFYLPEAHTDFLFAVLAEEMGLVGVLVVIGLYVVVVFRAFMIGCRAQLAGFHGSGYMAYGFAIWLGMQAMVNIGVNSGLLPTKGLTLPLLSYGGSSMLIIFVVIAILLRIDFETRKKGVATNQFRRSLY